MCGNEPALQLVLPQATEDWPSVWLRSGHSYNTGFFTGKRVGGVGKDGTDVGNEEK